MKIIYGTENCYKCKQLIDELNKEGENFKFIDIKTLSTEKLIDLTKGVNSLSLPIVING